MADNYGFDELARIVRNVCPELTVDVTLRGDDVFEFMKANRSTRTGVLVSLTGFDADTERHLSGDETGEVKYPEAYAVYYRGKFQRGDERAAYRELMDIRDAIQFADWKSDDTLTDSDRMFVVEGGVSMSDADVAIDCFTIHVRTTSY